MNRDSLRSCSAYPALLGLGALDAASYSIVAPVLPAISVNTGAGPVVLGAFVAAFPLGIVVAFPLAGRSVFARGTRPVTIVSLLLVVLGSLGFVFGATLPAYFVSRFVMGLGSGGLWIAVTFGTLERWPGQEYMCMSRMFASYSVGGPSSRASASAWATPGRPGSSSRPCRRSASSRPWSSGPSSASSATSQARSSVAPSCRRSGSRS